MPNIAALITVAAVMFAALGAITLIAHIYNLNNIKSKTVGDGQHGTARWANKAEIRKTYRHIPFTPKKWRRQAKQNQTPTMTATAPRKLLRKKTEPTEEALPQGIVVGCKGGKPIRTSPPKKETAPDMTEAEIIKDLTETEVQSNEPS